MTHFLKSKNPNSVCSMFAHIHSLTVESCSMYIVQVVCNGKCLSSHESLFLKCLCRFPLRNMGLAQLKDTSLKMVPLCLGVCLSKQWVHFVALDVSCAGCEVSDVLSVR